MTSCTSPRSATSRRYAGSPSSVVEQRRRPSRSSSTVSSSGTKPIRATPPAQVDQPGLAGQHHRGEHVVGAPGHRDDVALARPPGRSRSSASRIVVEHRERAWRRPRRAAAGCGRSGRRDRRAPRAAAAVRCSRGQVGVAPATARRAGRRAAPSAWWWASACSRTSSVARCSPNAADGADQPVQPAVGGQLAAVAQQRVAHEQQVVEQLGACRGSRGPGSCGGAGGDPRRGCASSLARMQRPLSR